MSSGIIHRGTATASISAKQRAHLTRIQRWLPGQCIPQVLPSREGSETQMRESPNLHLSQPSPLGPRMASL